MLWIDFETYNSIKDIKAGTYEYARTCEILLCAYAFDDGPVGLWDRTLSMIPADLFRAFKNPETRYAAHNAMFDRNVLRESLGLACVEAHDPANWTCTMSDAMLHGFPGGLDQLGKIFRLNADQAKIKDGKKLINRFCKPAPASHRADRYTRETHPDEWAQICEYVVNDVEAMRAVSKLMPKWNCAGPEYLLDQQINDRGFAVDGELVRAGAVAAVEEQKSLARQFIALTGGRVEKPTQRAQLLEFLNSEFGLALENTQSATFRELLDRGDLPETAQKIMGVAIASNKTSTAKYAALEPAISPDERFRGGLKFSGAQRTRRWSGQTFQPQNLPSRGLPKADLVAIYIEALKSSVQDILFDDDLMRYGSAAIRGVLVAPQGKKLAVSDLSNIEGRANAWLAGESWKLAAFRDYDLGDGHDLYTVTAGRILGRHPTDVTESERNNIGKVSELALGYEGGVGAFLKFSKPIGLRLSDHWGSICTSVSGECVDRAHYNYEKWGRERAAGEVDEAEWIACETIKLSWRGQNPHITALWSACKEAACDALNNPGQAFRAGPKLVFRYVRYQSNKYLLMGLPSGKYLVYFAPKITDDGISYYGVDSLTKQWTRQFIYGGKFVENACQSLSRDILIANMLRVEDAGYKIVLSVHDEVVTECPDADEFNDKKLSEILAHQPDWAKGFPLAAAGFEAYRYRK